MLLLLYIALILAVHLIPLSGNALDRNFVGPLRADHLLHCLLFFPWMVLVSPRLRSRPAGPRKITPGRHPVIGWLGLGIGLAAGAEALQLFVASRSFNPLDALFNALGVLLGAGAMALAGKWFKV